MSNPLRFFFDVLEDFISALAFFSSCSFIYFLGKFGDDCHWVYAMVIRHVSGN